MRGLPAFGTYCLGAVHREHLGGGHIVTGWREPQEFLETYFGALSPLVVRIDLGASGWYQGYYFDGDVTFIQLP